MHTAVTRARALEKKLAARRQWLVANGPCSHCGSTERLEVDHRDPETKVSHKVWSWAPGRRALELSKCQVLCHWCHMDKSALALLAPLVHGLAAYKASRCRCEICLKASREHKRQWRASRVA